MVKKLDKVDFDAIQSLSTKFNETTTKLTDITIQEHIISTELETAKNMKLDVLAEFDSIRREEQTVMSSLEKKYGRGEINIKDGTFTPTEKENIYQPTTDNV